MKTPPPVPIRPKTEPLDLELLAQLPSLSLRARYLVESGLLGQHRSPLKGYNADFVEYRGYCPGDEIRWIDWRFFARSDRLCVKRFEEENQLRVLLLLDVSDSMCYHSQPHLLTKLDFARTILAALVRLVYEQQDAAGVAFLTDELADYLPPRSTPEHREAIMQRLEHPPAGHHTRIANGLADAAEILHRRAMVIVASDFYEDIVLLEPALQRLKYDGHEVIGLHVLDPIEVDLENATDGMYVDVEDASSQPVAVSEIRQAYLRKFREFQDQLQELFGSIGGDFMLLRTDANPVEALSSYLAARARLV